MSTLKKYKVDRFHIFWKYKTKIIILIISFIPTILSFFAGEPFFILISILVSTLIAVMTCFVIFVCLNKRLYEVFRWKRPHNKYKYKIFAIQYGDKQVKYLAGVKNYYFDGWHFIISDYSTFRLNKAIDNSYSSFNKATQAIDKYKAIVSRKAEVKKANTIEKTLKINYNGK